VDDPAVQGIVVNTRDVSEQVEALERLSHQATHDVLTGLANRALLDERLAQAESAAARRAEAVAALFIDIDHFKRVNDTCGHSCGDLLLTEVAARLQRVARSEDTIGRIGGDEFVLIATVDTEDAVDELAARTRAAFAEPFLLEGGAFRVTASIGAATTMCLDGQVGLLEAADTALYAAKARGRDCWVRYDPSLCGAGSADDRATTSFSAGSR
jgi:diguanylate cyclase (GGDEF)-like protein